ncbi:MAG: FN3 associated domain-containing protein [Oscillospiraceae bacterium]
MLYKKILCFLIAAAVCTAVSGCAKENTDKNTDSTVPAETTSAAQTEVPDDDEKSLQFSHESGFYSDDITLEITGATGAKIYYTTDGSVPDETALLYTEPLVLKNKTSEPNVLSAQKGTSAGGDYIPRKNVNKANVIRAVAFFDDGSKSEIANGTFWIGIDREKEYGSVPVISLMTDMENLYDYETGIYILGKTYDEWKSEQNGHYEAWEAVGNYSCKGKEWERPVSVEFIPADGSEGFSQDMGFRIMGAASRSATQKSFRITAREEYGKKSLEYDLIPDKIIFKRFFAVFLPCGNTAKNRLNMILYRIIPVQTVRERLSSINRLYSETAAMTAILPR